MSLTCRCETSRVSISGQFLEEAAAKTVATVAGGDYELHDIPGRSSAYDYTIRRGDFRAAVEVTQATDTAAERYYGAIGRYGESFDAEGLQHHWMVAVDTPPSDFRARDLKRLQQDLLAMISLLETKGRTRFDCHRAAEAEREVCATYDFVKFGNTVDLDGPPDVRLNHVPVVAFDAGDLVEVAEVRARLDDNRRKLAKSGLGERHLFVWVNVWELGASAAFAVGVPPPRAPDLPEEVTDLWVGRLVDEEVQVWHFAGGTWAYHEVDTEKRP